MNGFIDNSSFGFFWASRTFGFWKNYGWHT